MTDKPDYLGHRERLKKRFLSTPSGKVAEYELLEILLFFANNRSDTKPLAKQLLKQFGNLARILHANEQDLLQIKGVGPTTLVIFKAIRESASYLIKPQIVDSPIISSWLALLDYCRVNMGHLHNEQLRVLYLNKQQRLISDQILQNGTIDQVSIYPREIVKQALFLGASSVILVHNHPSGGVEPSVADIEMTKFLENALASLEIQLLDHLIITSQSHFSFKTQGVI